MMPARRRAVLERYELLSELGEGGSGIVYEALDRETSERVALKELTHVNAASLARFKHEFRIVQEVHHPNIVRLDALFEDQGKWLIAMELVEGAHLLDYIYASDQELGFAEPLLRDTFCQLAEALAALHAAGLVHRDLKPTNVRVTPDGRLVLLDFGLATARDQQGQSSRANALGTVGYMAPEQAASQKLGPAADWYAFGVCLYQALSGVLPVDAESPLTLLVAKQTAVPALASSLTAGIPADLDQLASALLAIAPEARPDLAHIKRVLGSKVGGSSARPAPRGVDLDGPAAFEGREQELEQLEQALLRVQSGAPQVVLVEGDSGIGKSALVDCFLATLQVREPTPLVLHSRCYENELSAFKAFDGAMEGLARALGKLDRNLCLELLPPRAAVLCRLFPALVSVKAFARVPLQGLAADPGAQRLEAFSALGRLLTKLGERSPIVLAIDDLQWADAESFRLLLSLFEGWPHLPLLILATVRPPAELERDAAEGIGALRKLMGVQDVRLSGLPRLNAHRLARELMGPLISDAWLDIIVRESAGHPLFLTVLARFAESHDLKTAAELTLDAAIAARIGVLPQKARNLLETVAVVGSPLAATLCGRAAGLRERELGRVVADLCRQKLLRHRRAGELACFHDRIRRVAVECLPRARIRDVHGQVARTLAAHGRTDPAELARHYEAAGEHWPAYEAYRRGAEKALSSLAFVQAAVLYARALPLARTLQLPAAQRTQLEIALGHALARSGRSVEAAARYLETSQSVEGEERMKLRIWAAQHLLQSASVVDGLNSARALFEELDVPMPIDPTAAWVRLMWDRACVALPRLSPSGPRPIPVRERMQLDALKGLTMPISWIEPLASAAMGGRYLRLAGALGDDKHLAAAMAEVAASRMFQEPDNAESDKLLARARVICATVDDPALEVSVSFREASVAAFRWNLPLARERGEHAQQLGTERCGDQPWLLTSVRTNLAGIWAHVGEHARLAASCGAWLAEARDRNDDFALAMLEGLGFGHFIHLMADRPKLAQAALTAALAPWPREPYSFAHLGELVAVSFTELYRGGEGLVVRLQRDQPRMERSFLLKTSFGKALWLLFRAQACLSAANGCSAEQVAQLRGEAAVHMRQLRRIHSKLGAVHALGLEAQLLALHGNLPAALSKAIEARAAAQVSSHIFLARTMEHLEGVLDGRESGARKRSAALTFFAEQGWKNPRRAVALLCPAVDRLEPQSSA